MSSISKIYVAKAAFWKKEKKKKRDVASEAYILTPYAIIYFILLSFYPVITCCFSKRSKNPKENDEAGVFLQVLLFLSLGIQNGNNETVCILMIRFSLSHSTK